MSDTLIGLVKSFNRRMVVPLMGFPGIHSSQSTLLQNMFNAAKQAESLQKLADKFEPDAMFFMMDLTVEAGALGLPVEFAENRSPSVREHPVKTTDDLKRYEGVDILQDGRIKTFIDVTRSLKQTLSVPLGAYVIGPFTLAGLLMGETQISMATVEDQQLVKDLLTFCTERIIQYSKALEDAGADMICVLEPTASFISPRAFRKFSGPYVQKIFEACSVIPILHICGDSTHLIKDMAATGAQGLSLDADIDFVQAAEMVPEDVVLIGNLDPVRVMVNNSPEEVAQKVQKLLEQMAPYPNFILSTGCDLPPETPHGNIETFVKSGKAFAGSGK